MYKPRLDLRPGSSRPHPPSPKRLNLGKDHTDLRGSGHFLSRALLSHITSQARSFEEVIQAILASTMLEWNIHIRGLVTKPHISISCQM